MLLTIKGCCFDTGKYPRIGRGGEASVYRIPDYLSLAPGQPAPPNLRSLALKVYEEYDSAVEGKLRDCIFQGAYEKLMNICAPPRHLAIDGRRHVMGFTMRYVDGFTSVAEVSDLPYCLANKVTLRRVGALFHYIHGHLENIHSQGFVVGDLRGSNIMFKTTRAHWNFAFLDVDSWAVRCKGLNFPCTALHPRVRHPYLASLKNLQPYHDWYAFAREFAHCLLKVDPFEQGFHPVYDSDERRKAGVTCWDPKVNLTTQERYHTFRFGSELTDALKSWLTGRERGVFPKAVIENFLLGLVFCERCGFEMHKQQGQCPRCKERNSQ